MNRLIALDLPAGADFVLALRRCWDEGDAVVVLEPRLPAAARAAVISAATMRCGPHIGSRSRRHGMLTTMRLPTGRDTGG